MSFQIIVKNHLIHIITKKGSAAFLALTAPWKNWTMSSLASDMQQSQLKYLQSRKKNRERTEQKEGKK